MSTSAAEERVAERCDREVVVECEGSDWSGDIEDIEWMSWKDVSDCRWREGKGYERGSKGKMLIC